MIDFSKLKPSDCLQAMIDGLRENAADPKFRVDMESFGHVDINREGKATICFGCAATCTIAKLQGHLYSEFALEVDGGEPTTSYHHIFKSPEIGAFEKAIDAARTGSMSRLFGFLRVDPDVAYGQWEARFYLDTDDWEEQIPDVERVIKQMRETGV
jgi:hypothetical protein